MAQDFPIMVPSDAGDPGEAMGPLGMVYSGTEQNFNRLWVGAAGNITIRTEALTTRLVSNVPVGPLNMAGNRIMETGTTASLINGINELPD